MIEEDNRSKRGSGETIFLKKRWISKKHKKREKKNTENGYIYI